MKVSVKGRIEPAIIVDPNSSVDDGGIVVSNVQILDGSTLVESFDNATKDDNVNNTDATPQSNAGTVGGGGVSGVAKRPSSRAQRYRPQWEKNKHLTEWLAPVPGNPYRAWCRLCNCQMIAQLKVLLDHSTSRKHTRSSLPQLISPPSPVIPASVLGPRAEGLSRAPVTPTDGVADDCESAAAAVPSASGVTMREANNSPQPCWLQAPSGTRAQTADIQYGGGERRTLSIGLCQLNIGFIGAGKLAQAIATGMMNRGIVSARKLMVSSPSQHNKHVWKSWNCMTTDDNADVLRHCEVIFVAVPVNQIQAVVCSLPPLIDNKQRCFISTLPGVSVATLTDLLEKQLNASSVFVVRCVLSRTVSIAEGICAYSTCSQLSANWLLVIETLLSSLGVCQRVDDERQLNAYSGAFSAGVAFAALFIDALAAGAANNGVRWEDALQMAAHVTQGTASMILGQGVTPGELRRESCPPGGSALAGLMMLQKHGMEYSVMAGVNEATKQVIQIEDQL